MIKFPKPSPHFYLILAVILPIIVVAMVAVQFQQLFRIETQIDQVMTQLNAEPMPTPSDVATVSAEESK